MGQYKQRQISVTLSTIELDKLNKIAKDNHIKTASLARKYILESLHENNLK